MTLWMSLGQAADNSARPGGNSQMSCGRRAGVHTGATGRPGLTAPLWMPEAVVTWPVARFPQDPPTLRRLRSSILSSNPRTKQASQLTAPDTGGSVTVKDRESVERDVLAEAVAWTARALPSPADRAGPRRHAAAGRRRAHASPASTTTYRPRPRCRSTRSRRKARALVSGRLLAEISRSLPARPVPITATHGAGRAVLTCGSATFNLLTMPEDEYPALPEMPPAAGHGGQRRVRHRGQPGGDRGRPGRHAARADRRADRDRGRHAHADLHRPLPAARCGSCAGTRQRQDQSAAVLVPARALSRDGPGADRRGRGVHRPGPARR